MDTVESIFSIYLILFVKRKLILCLTFQIGDRVCVKRSVAEPRYAWGGETHHSAGRITEIENDGLLVIEIPNRPSPWQADPSDMEKVEDFKVKVVCSFVCVCVCV